MTPGINKGTIGPAPEPMYKGIIKPFPIIRIRTITRPTVIPTITLAKQDTGREITQVMHTIMEVDKTFRLVQEEVNTTTTVMVIKPTFQSAKKRVAFRT